MHGRLRRLRLCLNSAWQMVDPGSHTSLTLRGCPSKRPTKARPLREALRTVSGRSDVEQRLFTRTRIAVVTFGRLPAGMANEFLVRSGKKSGPSGNDTGHDGLQNGDAGFSLAEVVPVCGIGESTTFLVRAGASRDRQHCPGPGFHTFPSVSAAFAGEISLERTPTCTDSLRACWTFPPIAARSPGRASSRPEWRRDSAWRLPGRNRPRGPPLWLPQISRSRVTPCQSWPLSTTR